MDSHLAKQTVRRRTYLGVVVVLLLILSACGGESEVATNPGADVLERASVDADNQPDTGVEPEDVTVGSGDGMVAVGDISYELVTSVCFAQPGNFSAEGFGRSDGEFGDAWISISADTNEDYDDDGIADVTADVTIEHGKTDGFGGAAYDAPDLYATRLQFSTQPEGINPGSLTFLISGSTIDGAGEVSDANGVLIPFGETLPFTFTATCS